MDDMMRLLKRLNDNGVEFVLIGGMAAWLRQAKWRRTARRLEREIANLHLEIEGLQRTAGISGAGVNAPAAPPERLQLRPPTP